MGFRIVTMEPADWEQVSSIYWEGIQTKIATFQTELPPWEQWNLSHSQDCRLVAKEGDTVLGWAALTPVSDRCVYAGVANVSLYVGQQYRHQGVGSALLSELVRVAEAAGYWTLESRIIQENRASLAVHAKCGFRLVGVRERLGKMDTGIWYDVALVERRSTLVGMD